MTSDAATSFELGSTKATPESAAFLAAVSPESRGAPESGIAELFNYGRGRQGLIPLWVGEGDLAAPSFVAEAAARSLSRGETFYSFQGGVPELREAICRYMSRHYGAPYEATNGPFTADRFSVTTGGIHALQIAVRLTCGQGDEVIVPTPAWPNFQGVVAIAGAVPVEVPMQLEGAGTADAAWTLDIARIEAAITPRTRALIINSPTNPTGWSASVDELRALRDLARHRGLWIIADEIYGRIVYDGARAPSFHDVIEADDRVIFIHTLSKNWAMTGLRLGWIEAPPALGPTIANLIQYSTSGVAVPLQRGAAAALEYGEPFIARQLERFRRSRDILCQGLAATGKVHFARPTAAFYVFAAFAGRPDTRALAFTLVEEANVGVAPGSAFGQGGQTYVRLCFARDPNQVADATQRLVRWVETALT
ncbi:pyridoxal phosphate-dependent aminotransferase [Beijerinckia sp. L45]|uniref:pyridoxal phosphate-dependent aminotransferase n=1 Tax=Beijerinckia sp. L45 TaxID=1641855 RepID=UPI00131ABBAB|nr:pyridoxal phosphate-dependent aminotransferase [Beijerinckia sp. L45]